MKVCAPFVLAVAVGLAKAVPQHYVDRIARDEHFYGPLGRRCRQKARALESAEAAATATATAGSGASTTRVPRRQGTGSLKRASLAKPPPKVAGARKATQRSNSLLDLRGMEREQEALYSPRQKAPLSNGFAAASPSRSHRNVSSNTNNHGSNELTSPKASASDRGVLQVSKDEPSEQNGAESDRENQPTPLSRNQIASRESCLF